MHKEYKHPAPYRPDYNYLEGIHAANKHIKDITKGGTHPGQAQHLGGMASYRNHLQDLHYGPGESIKKDLKRVLDYLFYYSKTDHDIYHFLAEDALMHMDQMVAEIDDPGEKEHIRYFVECVREYMAWLKTDDAKYRNKNREYGENPGMNSQRNWERGGNKNQNMGGSYNNPNEWDRGQNMNDYMGDFYNNPNRGQNTNDFYNNPNRNQGNYGPYNNPNRDQNMMGYYDNPGGQYRSQGMRDQDGRDSNRNQNTRDQYGRERDNDRNDSNRNQSTRDQDGRDSNRSERDGQDSANRDGRSTSTPQTSESKDASATQQKGTVNL